MPFCACVCPYAYPYALVKTKLKRSSEFAVFFILRPFSCPYFLIVLFFRSSG